MEAIKYHVLYCYFAHKINMMLLCSFFILYDPEEFGVLSLSLSYFNIFCKHFSQIFSFFKLLLQNIMTFDLFIFREFVHFKPLRKRDQLLICSSYQWSKVSREVIRQVSSANKRGTALLKILSRSFMYFKNRRGPRLYPWGTPYSSLALFKLYFCNLAIIILWLTTFLKSLETC